MITRSAIFATILSLVLAAGAVPALAKEDNERPAVVNVACMQTAVEKRDNALIAGVDAYHTSVRKALEVRRDALKAAWGVTDRKDRREALQAAWKTYKESRGAAAKALKSAKRAAWEQFKMDRKGCSGAGYSEDRTGPGVDAQL